MIKIIVIGAILLSLILVVVACAGPTSSSTPQSSPTPAPFPNPSGPIKAEWIEPQVNGDIVSIPVSEIEDNWNIHFPLTAGGTDMNFMAYVLDEEIHVRANVCPPCRSIGFALEGDILVCDRCATTFEAKTGDGIQGACVDYPKESVPYEMTDGNIIMRVDDLVKAYTDTIKAG